MTGTPMPWKSPTQVNTSDGALVQDDGQIVGLQDGGYVVVWTDNSHTYSSGPAIVGQRYDSAGNKVVPPGNTHGGEVDISKLNGSDCFSPAVTILPNGNIAVAFVRDSSGSDHNIFVSIVNPALQVVGTVNIDDSTNDTVDPSIAAFADGSYVVSYTLNNPINGDIVARRVGANGMVGGQFDIDTQTEQRDFSELATLSNGNFVAVYEAVWDVRPDPDVLFGIFTPNGAPVARFQFVPGIDTRPETDPDVAALRHGGFVVAWTDEAAGETDIRASILSNAGGAVASGILVNTHTAGAQNSPSVVALADGGFLVAWEDDQPGFIRAQRFDAVGDKIGSEFAVDQGVAEFSQRSHIEAAQLSDGARIAFAYDDRSTGDLDVVTSIFSIAAPNDFNANSISDILWQSDDGTPAVWLMDGTDATTASAAGSFNPGPTWHVKASADFDGDGKADILWQGNDGTAAMWLMDGPNATFAGAAGPFNPGPSWQIKGTGDFNGDGKSDILWQGQDGTPAIWLMDGNKAVSVGAAGSFNPGPSWQVKGSGDFDGDGKADILWQGNDGTAAIWLMDGTNTTFAGAVGPFNPGPSWQIKATGDFNGDNKSDILWQNSDGTAAIWLMNGMNAVTVGAVGPFNPGPSWHIEGTGDFNGDGKSDILWQGDDGTPAIWFMDGMNFLSGGAAGSFNPGHDWHVIA